MKRYLWLSGLMLTAVCGFFWLHQQAPSTQAAVYWFAGVQDGPDITVCFAGDAVANRPARVREVITHIQELEYAANIRFMTMANTRASDEIKPGRNLTTLACPPPTQNGNVQSYAGDIRVALYGAGLPMDPPGMVPGAGCPQPLVDGSWSNPPIDLEDHRSCQYNLKLGDDGENGLPYLNHTLHEFGHALGLAHEHQRTDANAGCTEKGYGTGLSGGFLTPYDRDSVMHYKFNSCGINGNYDYTGLSAWDRLALHILYPEDNQVAEFVGTTVIRESQLLSLQSAWLARGANLNFAASNFVWHINGNPYLGPTLEIDLGVGEYILEFSYQDFLKRDYYYSGPVRVLAEDDFNAQVVAPIMTNLPLIYPNFFYEYTADLNLQLDENVSIFFPAGLFASDVVIDYARQPPLEVSMQHIGLFYDLAATDIESGEPAEMAPGQTYSVTIQYDDTAVPIPFNESDLALYYWDGDNWVLEASSQLDTVANRLTATPNHFSSWAVLARNPTYLPVITRH